MAMRLNCYGGPLDGTAITVKYPGRGLEAPVGDEGGRVLYRRERYWIATRFEDRRVNVFLFGDPDAFTDRVVTDTHDASAFEQQTCGLKVTTKRF